MLKYHIQTIEVPSGGSSAISFSGIPQVYDDLYLVLSSRTTNTGTCAVFISFNGSTSNFSSRALEGNGSAASSFTLARFIGGTNGSGTTSNVFTSVEVHVPNYRSSAAKSYSATNANENNTTEAFQTIIAGFWNDASAINSLVVTPQLGNFTQFSSASLYGIKRGSDGRTEVASGGTITTSGGFTYHTFRTSGTFVANRSLQFEALVIAGGGSAGYDWAAGGGAGGIQHLSSTALATGSYAVTVGSGGAGSMAGGANGSNSSFASSVIAIGGGRGGSSQTDGAAGGSGGGGNQFVNRLGGAAVAGIGGTFYGNAGGNGLRGPSGGTQEASGGGGGSGQAGQAGYLLNGGYYGGNGGNGTTAFSAWGLATSTGENVGGVVYYAGGGGGAGRVTSGTGGLGGGGDAAPVVQAGAPNTGGGGAGDSQNGGSGLVIIRYPTPA